MQKELRRSLFAAALVGATLAGCGDSGTSKSSAGAPAPGPAPAPAPAPGPPAAPGSYFQAGRAGGTMSPGTIQFFNNSMINTSPFGLVYWDPTVAANAYAVTTQKLNQLEAGGLGLDLATVGEYFPNAGTATAWGMRYRVYAQAGPANAGLLYAVDLRKSGTVVPSPVQISSGTVASMNLCPALAPLLFDNYRSADQSWIVFHAAGTTPTGQACGSLADTFVGIQPATPASTAPKLLGTVEPVEALYDANGTITSYLAINHTALDSTGNPMPPVLLQQVDAGFANAKTVATLVGKGSNTAVNGDFRSLGVSATTNVLLYFDNTSLNAVDLTTAVTTPIGGFTLAAGATVQGGAVFDGAKAYVAFGGTSAGGSQIVQVDTTTKMVTATQTLDAAGAGGITLVGVTSNNVVYLVNDGSAIKSLLKSSLMTSAATLWPPAATSQRVDSLMGSTGPSGAPIAFLVGDTVYFTVADSAASGATGFAKQPFYVSFNGSGAPGAAAAIGTGVGAVLGVVAPSSIPTRGAFTNAGALVLTGGANDATTLGQAVFASASVASSLGLYGPAGVLTTSVGAFTKTNAANSMPRVNPITGVALNSGPVQVGMPAMLEMYGLDGSNDMAIYTPDAASSLMTLSGFVQ